MRKSFLAALCAAGAVLAASTSAQAGFQYHFDIDFAQATCNGGLTCANDQPLDTFQVPDILSTSYSGLLFHTSAVAGQDVAYGGAGDADNIGQITFDPLGRHNSFVWVQGFELIPLVAGTYDVSVNGVNYTVGPQGLTLPRLAPNVRTLQWTNDTVVGIANIIGVVPEPATWGLMLAGMFGLGGALRARRRSAVSAV